MPVDVERLKRIVAPVARESRRPVFRSARQRRLGAIRELFSQMRSWPSRDETNAMKRPSGDAAGAPSFRNA